MENCHGEIPRALLLPTQRIPPSTSLAGTVVAIMIFLGITICWDNSLLG